MVVVVVIVVVASGRSVTYRSRCRRRVKLSSPSIDLNKGRVAASASSQSLRQSNPDVRNVALPTKDDLPTLQDEMTGDSFAMETEASSRSEDAVTVLTSSDSLPSVLHVTLLKEPENCAVNWLDYAASVDMTDVVTQELKDMCDGTKGTKDAVDILKCEEGAVSQIMDVTNDVATFHSYAKTPPTSVTLTDMVKRESEERGCLPKKCNTRTSVTQQMVACSGATSHPTMALRPPLYSLSNVTDNGQGRDSLQSHTSLHWQLYQVTGAPPSGQESVLRSNQLLLPPSDKMKPEDSVPCETTSNISAGGDEMENVQPSSCSSSRSGRIDHRKTSWMNGFMMYSRLHRKLYIEENPGVHTSHISKLMGHDWRQLSPTQQQPYRLVTIATTPQTSCHSNLHMLQQTS
ncbi:hypothetical protein LSAT2_001657 [Lamellibrachia satsuma]|nr:hypothetical protein LSAT2_001657 [Lamellibrachia satsuma]